jgi:23S rRNA maturation-related 3'-5' exoribonuclease YhaM
MVKIEVSVWREKNGDIQMATGTPGNGFRARISPNPASVAHHHYLFDRLDQLLVQQGETEVNE